MKYKNLPSDNYKENRKKFLSELNSHSIAVFNSNDIYPISSDATLPFEQHRDIFYLTGIDQEETVLLLHKGETEKECKEIVFVKKTNKHIAIWEGEKLTKENTTKISGISNVEWTDSFEKIFDKLEKKSKHIYINTNEHYRAKVETQTRDDRFINWCKNKYPNKNYLKSNFILQRLRSIKSDDEINQIKRACSITEKGFRRVLNFIKPNVWEYEIEAEYAHEFLNNKSKGFAYQPIIASGTNNNVLHYLKNDKQCKNGDLILMDVGAEYGNYSSDMTRTVPVNGRFSKRQKDVYNAVLRVKNESEKMLVKGADWKNYHIEVGKIMTSELLALKLISKADIQNESKELPAYKKYFMHGTSHHLGLNTHDYGLLEDPMEKNMVFTVEPGIYIPSEGFGIRLEDDVVVQEKGPPVNLMKSIPIEADEIEELMNS